MAYGQTVLDAQGHIGFGLFHCFWQGAACRQFRSQGGRKAAAGTVGIGVGEPLAGEPFSLEPAAFSRIQQIIIGGIRQMTPFQEYGPGSFLTNSGCCLFHIFLAVDGKAGQHFPLLHIGRDQCSQGQQLFLQVLPGVLFQEIASRSSHHHRIHHQYFGGILLHFSGDGPDQGRIGHHSHLHPVHPDILEYRVDLGFHHFRVDVLDGCDPSGILGRHGSDYAHAVAAMSGKCLQVRLDAGAAGRIRPGNGQQMEHIFLLLSEKAAA